MRSNAALETLQQSIISGDTGIAASLVRVKPHMNAEEQIAIYSNAYRMRLRHAVVSDYPCLLHYYGDKLHCIVDAYVASVPSHSYSLDFYPHAFWRFAQKLLPADMAELAELEGGVAECFMTKGNSPLRPEDLPQDEESLGRMRFYLRAPHRLLALKHDVDAAMTHYKNSEVVTPIAETMIYLLVYRPANDVKRRRLEAGEYRLLQAITETTGFGDAIQKAQAETGMTDEVMATHVMRWLPAWMKDGCLSAEA